MFSGKCNLLDVGSPFMDGVEHVAVCQEQIDFHFQYLCSCDCRDNTAKGMIRIWSIPTFHCVTRHLFQCKKTETMKRGVLQETEMIETVLWSTYASSPWEFPTKVGSATCCLKSLNCGSALQLPSVTSCGCKLLVSRNYYSHLGLLALQLTVSLLAEKPHLVLQARFLTLKLWTFTADISK